MLKNLFSRNSTDESKEPPAQEPSPQGETPTEGDTAPEEKLSRADKVGYLVQGAPDAFRQLRSEWKEDRVQFYFLLYSAAASFVSFWLILQDRQMLLFATFGIYAITALPLLYIYEEETYFQQEDNPLLNRDN